MENSSYLSSKKTIKFPIAAVFFFIIIAIRFVGTISLWGNFKYGIVGVFPMYDVQPINQYNLVETLLLLAIGVLFLMKRRDNLLVIVLAVLSGAMFLSACFSGSGISLRYAIMPMLPFVALTALAVLKLGDKDEAQLGWVKYLWLLPGLLGIPRFLVGSYWGMFDMILGVLLVVALFFAGYWLVFPYVSEKSRFGSNGAKAGEGYIDMAKHVILTLLIGGVWTPIWIYRTTCYCNRVKNGAFHKPVANLLLFMFVPFYSIYWYAKQGQRLDAIAQEHGDSAESAMTYLLLGIFVPLVAVILMQDRINKIARNTYAEPLQPVKDDNNNDASFEKLRELKSLLDAGVITEDEFAAKKKQLLEL